MDETRLGFHLTLPQRRVNIVPRDDRCGAYQNPTLLLFLTEK